MNDEQMIQGGHSSEIDRLRAIMHRLRAPNGCPWDAEQTHDSLISNLIEETYETVDAIRSGDDTHLQEELGDLLLQVIFHSEIAEEAGRFDLDSVAKGISEKLIRRHPHVFSNAEASNTDQVLKQWDAIKREEKGETHVSYLHGVGKGLPALIRAAKLQKKASKIGFDWTDETGVIAKISEELQELKSAINDQDSHAVEEELGDLLFSIVNLSRFRKIDPEVLMARANSKFEGRFAEMEKELQSKNIPLEDASLVEMEEAWIIAKQKGF